MTLLLFYLTLAIGVSFLCSILEAVLLSMTPSYVQQVQASRPGLGKRISEIKGRLDESLSSILILNTFAHTMGAAGVGSQALQVFGAEWETLIAVLLTLAILYFSEIIPKTLGATFWKQLAPPSVYLIGWLVKLVYPLVWVSTRLTRLFSNSKESEITREEIIAIATLGRKDGALVQQENEYLLNLLKLREIRTEKIYTPRTVVHMLQENTTVSKALDNPLTKQFSRIPIYSLSVDDVQNKIIKSDLYEAERNGQGDKEIRHLAQPIVRVSEKLPVQNLLNQFIKKKEHLFLVEDEFGQTSGVVSLEDAIETLLGKEIVDEHDLVEDLQALAKNRYRDRLRETSRGEEPSDQ